MPSSSNIVEINDFRSADVQQSKQEMIDDIGAKAFVFMRDEAEAMNLPVREVLTEHMLGLAMVIESVEGSEEARIILADIARKLGR